MTAHADICATHPQDHGGNLREARERYGLTEVLDFSASINPLGCPEGLRDRLLTVWDEVAHYPDRHCRAFCSAVANHYGIGEDAVVAGNGSAELIDLLLRFLAPRRLLVSPPDFGLYEALAPPRTTIVRVPRRAGGRFAPDLAKLAHVAEPGDVVIFSNPGNPAGCRVPPSEILALADAVREVGATVVVDEAFADFCPGASVLREAAESSDLVVLRSLTKFYAIPGLRLGFLVASPERARSVMGRQVPWSVNTLAQEAGIYCLGRTDWADRTLSYVAEERACLADGLARLPGLGPLPSEANYLLVRVSPPAPHVREIYDRSARRGVLIRHCGSFGLGESYLRVAVRTRSENERLLEVLGGILAREDRPAFGREGEAEGRKRAGLSAPGSLTSGLA